MVGYILLIVFAVTMGAIVFTWLKTYTISEGLNCPDGVSVFVKEATFNNLTLQLNLTTKNNGRFDIAGYFAYASNNSSQELAIIDLSAYLNESSGGKKFGNSVVFLPGENSMSPGNTRTNIFDIPSSVGEPYSVRVIPTRFQEENNRQRFVSCSEAVVSQKVGEPFVCVPNCAGRVCGSNGCGGSCGTCGSGFFCDAVGQCISTSCTPVLNPCGTFVCGTATNGTCGSVSCGTCALGFSCNATGQCQSTIGNGICDPGEDCSEPACEGQQAQCQANNICQGGNCTLDTSGVSSCPGYCVLFGYSGTSSACTNSAGNCREQGGTYIGDVPGANAGFGNSLCTGGAQADTCCCKP